MTPDDFTRGLTTVSDKIRALDAAGYSRTEIHQLLGKRYQHVRNVLVDTTAEQADRARVHVQSIKGTPTGSTDGVEETARAWELAPDPKSAETESLSARGVVHLVVGAGGEVVLPPAVLAALELTPGSRVTARLKGETFTLISAKENLSRIQALVREFVPPGSPSMADELIADRRREAARERQNG